jgi:hypothetical protein
MIAVYTLIGTPSFSIISPIIDEHETIVTKPYCFSSKCGGQACVIVVIGGLGIGHSS